MMLRGIVKWFNPRTGLGIIVPTDDHTTNVVVHSAAIAAPARSLRPGEAVAYELDPGRPGLVRVVTVGGPAEPEG